jgi:hypothetical protein
MSVSMGWDTGTVMCQISGSHGGRYEDTAFWDTAPFRLVEVDRRFIALLMEAVRAVSQKAVMFN